MVTNSQRVRSSMATRTAMASTCTATIIDMACIWRPCSIWYTTPGRKDSTLIKPNTANQKADSYICEEREQDTFIGIIQPYGR